MDAAEWKALEDAEIDSWGAEPEPPAKRGFLPFPGAEPGKRDLTHDGLALELGDEWKNEARYVAAWGRWLFYGEPTWRQDETLEHMTRTRAYLRDVADRLGPEHEATARRLRAADTVARVVSLARSNLAQAATVEQWDASRHLLGTPAGPVCLISGVQHPPHPEHYITKSTAVAPAPEGTPAHFWEAFLDRITDGDRELQSYLQRSAGYALTGDVSEHVFWFGHGTGANGKSVYVNTLNGIMADYSLSVDSSMLMASQTEAHPTELARLRGVRLAVGSEVEEGRRWAEAKLKRLTGGDPVPARFMRQDFFEFMPQFKLFIVGNHKPSLRGVDEGIRRRLHLVPFSVTIPPEERDPSLFHILKDEWPAILRWMIDGAVAWGVRGLDAPTSVRAATDEYLEAEDALSLWLDEAVELDPNAWEAGGSLFASWKRWAEKAGEYVGSQKRFSGILQERGFTPQRQSGTGIRGFRGVRITVTGEPERWAP